MSNTKQNEWEKEFRRTFCFEGTGEFSSLGSLKGHLYWDRAGVGSPDFVIAFITKLLADARREVIEEIEKLQKDFRVQASKLPQYREAGMDKVFYFEGNIENELDVAFLEYIKLKLATPKEETLSSIS